MFGVCVGYVGPMTWNLYLWNHFTKENPDGPKAEEYEIRTARMRLGLWEFLDTTKNSLNKAADNMEFNRSSRRTI